MIINYISIFKQVITLTLLRIPLLLFCCSLFSCIRVFLFFFTNILYVQKRRWNGPLTIIIVFCVHVLKYKIREIVRCYIKAWNFLFQNAYHPLNTKFTKQDIIDNDYDDDDGGVKLCLMKKSGWKRIKTDLF